MNAPVQLPPPEQPPPRGIPRFLKLGVLLLLVVGVIALIHFTAFGRYQADWNEAMKYLRGHELGWLVPVAFVALVAGLVTVGMPRLALCAASGAAFGFFWGMLWAEIGTVLGSYALFLFARWAGRDKVLRRWPALERYSLALTRGGLGTVLLTRQLPINGFFVSVTLALTELTHAQYLLGTALGYVPQAIPVTLMGAGVGQRMSLARSASYVLIAVCWLLVAGLFLKRFRRVTGAANDPAQNRASPDANPPERGA